MADDLNEIQTVLQTYFDGVHNGDTSKLAAAFHETADLRGVNADGTLSVLPRKQWLDGLGSRPSAASQKLERRDAIISIDRSGPDTAFAKVQCQIPPRYFTDYLVLARLKDGWKIVSKSYHTDVR
jgi:hypothetical protein